MAFKIKMRSPHGPQKRIATKDRVLHEETTKSEANCVFKTRYESQRIAQLRADHRTSVDGHLVSIYRCPHCKYWHLTSKLPKPKRERKRRAL